MANRDFFGFCTSLKPIELKALGALSHVEHIEANKTIYRAGDVADTLYIINRGMVEIVQEGPASAARVIYLSRGDIFGDVEVFTDLPRKHSVRTREPVSAQCFSREHFPELVRRVPTFFCYLSEQLAVRLLQARDAALSRSHCVELSGTLANFDLVTIYQTILNSAQNGELSISAENGEALADFHFANGRVCGGHFQHLIGDEAFSQLFQAANLRGTFSFCTNDNPSAEEMCERAAVRDPGEMLIGALQARDELDALRAEMPDSEGRLLRQKLELSPNEVVAEHREVAQKIWNLASGGRLQLNGVYKQLDVSELKIYQAVHELIETGHLELAPASPARKVA